ncbi:MAG: CHRD domain-containing protein [Cocleimonas sp.]|nr:CHRD domain-containing protein [Cocleimonas sp.]
MLSAKNTLKKIRMLVFFMLATAMLNACNSSSSDVESFQVKLSAQQENPAINGEHKGVGNVNIDTETGEISGSIALSNLTGDATAAHIHTGDAGVNGAVVLALAADPTNKKHFIIPNGSKLNSEELKTLLRAGLYFNVHTQAHPSGEVRGQIIPNNYKVSYVTLSGKNEVPMNSSKATGHAYITTETTKDHKIRATMTVNNLDTANAAHLHLGKAGVNGAVIIGFLKQEDDASHWRLVKGSKLIDADYETFLKGGLYLNVHSPAFPSGELRGQVIPK